MEEINSIVNKLLVYHSQFIVTGRHFKPRDHVQTTFMPMKWGGGTLLFRKAQKVTLTGVCTYGLSLLTSLVHNPWIFSAFL